MRGLLSQSIMAMMSGSLLAGCASKPASPVPAPLSDLQAISLAENYLDGRGMAEPRFVKYVEPTGDGNIVSFRTGFEAGARPPVQTQLVMVKHNGAVRGIRFREGR